MAKRMGCLDMKPYMKALTGRWREFPLESLLASGLLVKFVPATEELDAAAKLLAEQAEAMVLRCIMNEEQWRHAYLKALEDSMKNDDTSPGDI